MALKLSLGGACFCVITGASQGIGRSLAVECSQQMGPGSVLLLMARNEEGLQMTKSLAQTSNVRVVTKSIDLSRANTIEMNNVFQDALAEVDVGLFDNNIIIHNAGSIGDVTLSASQLSDVAKWQDYYNLNVFNIAALNCMFLEIFERFEDRTVVVNVTSLCGIKPFAGLSLYCSGKAAREMYFKVLAEERPQLKVLNYSPGPVQTAMVQNIIDNASNLSLRDSFTVWQSERKLLEPEQTAKKCLLVLCNGNYKSGDHVDYFD